MNEELTNVEDEQIRISKKYYLNLGFFASVVLWAIAATAYFINETRVTPLNNEILELKLNSMDLRTKNNGLFKEISKLKSDYSEISKKYQSPSLLFPYDRAVAMGNNINFRWNYSKNEQYPSYILEIRSFSNSINGLFNVINPETNSMSFPTSRLEPGEYLWRIIPGIKTSNKSIAYANSSNYRTFNFYNSVFEKIKKTKEIRVAISPSLSGRFNYLDEHGDIIGFDCDLIKWVSKKLGKHLDIKNGLNVIFVDTPWHQLLTKLKSHEVDVVISSMSSTKKREEDNKGVKFTKGYYQVNQIFIKNKNIGGEFPESLKGKNVGVAKNTTNEMAARYLMKKYGFNIRNSYMFYSDLYSALDQSEIDYALVDDVLVLSNYLGTKFFKFGGDNAEELKDFYRDEFKRENEMYAIAVALGAKSSENNILEFINNLLESNDGVTKLEELKDVWLTKP